MAGFANVLSLNTMLAGGLPLSFLLMSSILPVIKVLLIAATGLVFAQPKLRVLNSGARHSLSKVSVSFSESKQLS